ncbi:HAD family hydrolase, partial [bacterium]|nr:HAD family hydrolase [bacterium]
THLCKKILAQSGVEKERILFVGDTYHDYETAAEIGCRAALISRGHNTAEKLRISGASIFPSLRNLADTLKSEI